MGIWTTDIGQWKTAIEQGETNIGQWETYINIDKYIMCIDTKNDIDNINTDTSTVNSVHACLGWQVLDLVISVWPVQDSFFFWNLEFGGGKKDQTPCTKSLLEGGKEVTQ